MEMSSTTNNTTVTVSYMLLITVMYIPHKSEILGWLYPNTETLSMSVYRY